MVSVLFAVLWFNIYKKRIKQKKQGIEINTWTVNEEADIRCMIERGVTSIIGNFPDRVSRVRKELESIAEE